MKNTTFFSDYLVKKKISEGAYSEIYEVEKQSKKYALKKLKAHLKHDRDQQTLLKTEAKLLKNLNDPHFPILYESGKWNEEIYLILELIHGINLEELIFKHWPLCSQISLPLKCYLIREICLGLEILHQKNDPIKKTPLVHGDLRASNTILSIEGEMKIIDLGLKGGTFDYMPLERLHENLTTPFSDIYATGHIFFELLHGKRLFKADTKLEAYFEMRNLEMSEKTFDPSLPSEIGQILLNCLHQQKHFQNVQSLLGELKKMIGQTNEFKLKGELKQIMAKIC